MARYYVVDDDNGGGCITALIVGLVIIMVVAYFALYVLMIALGIIFFASFLLGAIFTIKNYILALRDSIATYGHSYKPSGWILPNFVYRWIMISWGMFKGAWVYTGASVKDFFSKVGFYRVLSFKKWINLFSALSVLIFGTIMSFLFLLLNVYVILIVLGVIFSLLATVFIIFALIGLGVSMAVTTTNYITKLTESRMAYSTTLGAYITSGGYGEYIRIVKNTWLANLDYAKDGFDTFRSLPILSLKKWVRMGASVMCLVIGTLMVGIYAIIHLVIFSVLFAIFKIISLFNR